MGGMGIFRVRDDGMNLGSIVELLGGDGAFGGDLRLRRSLLGLRGERHRGIRLLLVHLRELRAGVQVLVQCL